MLKVSRKDNGKETARDRWPRKGWLESVDLFINRGTFFPEVVPGRTQIFSQATLFKISMRENGFRRVYR